MFSYQYFTLKQIFYFHHLLNLTLTSEIKYENILENVFHFMALLFFENSIQMIDCVAASLSLVLAYVCLEVQFHLTHVCGFGLGIMGAIGLCFANVWSKKGNNLSPRKKNIMFFTLCKLFLVGEEEEINWGDILRIESGLFLAFNSLAQELIVKSIDSVEYLGMVGLIGSFICGFQS